MKSHRKGGAYHVQHGALRFIVAPSEDGKAWTLTPDDVPSWDALGKPDAQERYPRKRDAMARIGAL